MKSEAKTSTHTHTHTHTHTSFNVAFESNKEVKRFKRCFKILQINLTNVILLHFYKTKH